MSNTKIPTKLMLEESELPKYWYNMQAVVKHEPALNPATLKPVTLDELKVPFCDELAKQEPELAACCVPECVYRGFCPEFKSCGFAGSPAFLEMVEKYRNV